MQQVQLYIEGERVELFKDETISLTQSIQNVKDPGKIFTEFSKSFTLPASKGNNKLFKHYYRVDMVGGFDARKKVPAEIKLNNALFRTGYIELKGTKLKNNACTSYKVNFVGSTVSLKETFKDDELSDLTWLDNFNRIYGPSQVNTALQTGYDIFAGGTSHSKAIIAPLISHTENLYYDSVSNQGGTDGNMYPQGGIQSCGLDWNDLKYSIRVSLIVKAIEEQYGIEFSDDFFDNSNSAYYGLYMWLHRNQGAVGGDDKNANSVILNLLNKLPVQSLAGFSSTANEMRQQGVGIFSSTADVYFTLAVSSSLATFDFLIKDENGSVVYQDLGNTGSLSYAMPVFTTVNNKYYKMYIRSNDVFTIYGATSSIRVVVTNTSIPTTYDVTTAFTANQVIVQEVEFNIRQEIPKMKVIDFLSGLFKTFNLTAYVLTDGTIKVQPLDAYYASGTTHDITEFIDVSTSAVNPPIPYNHIKFAYKDYKTYTASLYSSINGSEFGELDYKGENPDEWVGEEYSIVLPWQKMAYNKVKDLNDSSNTTCQVGWFVDEGQKPYKGSPLIHYTYRRSGGTGIAFSLTPGSYNSISNYHIPMNSEDIFATGQSLNFYPETDEYFETVNNNTLFETYYKTQFKDLFEIEKRIIKFNAILPLNILLKYSLADKFEINSKLYKINSITTNLQTGKSSIELLNEI
jgi:hypothetical protein